MKTKHCPINNQAPGGKPIGRCNYFLCDGFCPVHGEVFAEIKQYEHYGRCVLENEMRKRKHLPLLGEEKKEAGGRE